MMDTNLYESSELQKLILKDPVNPSKWGRIKCIWQEKKQDSYLTHIYLSTINLETGEIYLDCSVKKIYLKLFLHTLARPFIVTFETFYHALLPISITVAVIKVLKKNHSKQIPLNQSLVRKKCFIKSINCISDIIRTPLYGVIMIVVSLAALIIGPFAPHYLYDFREIEGKLIKQFHRKKEKVSYKDSFSCFQSIKQITKPASFDTTLYNNTHYTSRDPLQIGLSNWVKCQIEFLRQNRVPIRCYQLLDPNKPYLSPGVGIQLTA